VCYLNYKMHGASIKIVTSYFHALYVLNTRKEINPLAMELDIYSLAHHLCKL